MLKFFRRKNSKDGFQIRIPKKLALAELHPLVEKYSNKIEYSDQQGGWNWLHTAVLSAIILVSTGFFEKIGQDFWDFFRQKCVSNIIKKAKKNKTDSMYYLEPNFIFTINRNGQVIYCYFENIYTNKQEYYNSSNYEVIVKQLKYLQKQSKNVSKLMSTEFIAIRLNWNEDKNSWFISEIFNPQTRP